MEKKKWFRGICLLLIAVMVLCCVGSVYVGSRDPELPQIVIGQDSYAPHSDLSMTAAPVAIDAEIAAEAFRRMGYEPVFQRIDWDDADTLLESGEIDCLWDCLTMEGKEDKYQWVGPYLYASVVVVVQADSGITSLADLAGKRVSVEAGSFAERTLLEETNPAVPEIGTLYTFSSITQATTSLSKGYADAVVGFEGEMMDMIASSPTEFRMLDENLETKSQGVAFSKDYDPALPAYLNETLEEMRQDGTIAAIVEKYGMNVQKALGEKQ